MAEDDSPFSKEVPLTIGTKTEDTILEVLKEGEIEMLDSVWKIPPQSNKTIKAHTPLVLMGTSMNVMTEPLHQNDKAPPQGLHVCSSYGMYNCGSWKTTVQLYNTKDHAIVIKKGTAVARMVAANEVPEIVITNGAVGALQTQKWAKKAMLRSLSSREEKFCSKN